MKDFKVALIIGIIISSFSQVYAATIYINVHNVNNSRVAGAKVKLYKPSGTETKNTDSNGFVEFYGLNYGTYSYEVYYNGTGTEEFWGNGDNLSLQQPTLTSNFYRDWPYKYSESVPSNHYLGQQVNFQITVKNKLSFSRNVKVELWVDRSKSSSWDYYSLSSAQSLSASGSKTFSFPMTMPSTGNYYWKMKVYSYNNGAGSYIVTDTSAWKSAFTVSKPTGNLKVYVKNQNNVWPGGSGKVVLYQNGNYVDEDSISSSTGLANFNDIDSGSNYSYLVYYNGPRGQEYWGDDTGLTISTDSTLTRNFKRFYPYATSFQLKNNSNGTVINPSDNIEMGTTVLAEVTVYNGLSGQSLNCYVQTIYDRNRESPYDGSPTSSTISVPAKGSKLFTTTFTPSAEGTYYKALKVYSKLGAGDRLTDGTAFEQAFIVDSSFPSISGRIAFHSYSSYDNMDGVLSICELPSQNTYTVPQVLDSTTHQMNPHFSPDGSLVAFMAVPSNSPAVPGAFWSYLELYLYDFVSQQLIRLTNNANADEDPKFSPDGSQIVFKRGGDVHVMTLDGVVAVPSLTSTGEEESGPIYSPASLNKIAYWKTWFDIPGDHDTKQERIWWMNSDGTSPEQLVPDSNVRIMYYPVFLDSERLAYTRWLTNPPAGQGGLDQIYIYNVNTGTNSPVAFRDESANDSDAFSLKNSNLIGFSSTRAGSGYDLYIGDLQSGEAWDITSANTDIEDLGACFTTTTTPPATRTITVSSEPSGAEFTISGKGVNSFVYNGTSPWTNNQMQPGNYEITWEPLDGYVPPASETKYLVSGTISFSGNYTEPNPDISGDGVIDLLDFSLLSRNWLKNPCTAPNWCSGADINNSGTVDIGDLAIMAKHWLDASLLFIDDFENGDISSWSFGGDTPWIISSDEKNSGNYAASSGTINDDQWCYMYKTQDVPRGYISFARKVSCEYGDWLVFYIDGVPVDIAGGESDWKERQYFVGAGSHTFYWGYDKNSSVTDGSDKVWIDDVVYYPRSADPGVCSWAELRAYKILGEDMAITPGDQCYYVPYYETWVIGALNGGFTGTFNCPNSGQYELRVTHQTSASAGCQGGGYAPVTISVNGSPVVSNYDPAENHGGTHGSVTDSWTINANSGSNTFEWKANDLCTNYWIQKIEIRVIN